MVICLSICKPEADIPEGFDMSGPALIKGLTRYILVVDSGWNERFTLSMLLQRFGYRVASTNSVREAVEYLCVAPAHAVFVEAGAAGTELMARLKTDLRFRDVPIVVVAEHPDRALEERLRQGEIGGLLLTPLDPEKVFLTIQKVIEKGPRSNIRIATALPVVMHDVSGAKKGYVTVLSQLGIFFRTIEPCPVNTRLAFDLSFWDRTVRVEAEVLYVVSFEEGPFREPGMGLKFVQIAPEDSLLIRAYIYEQLDEGIVSAAPGRA